ncbi:MAG: DUF721 domain-containing protein [Planctomycetaceae bacterium]
MTKRPYREPEPIADILGGVLQGMRPRTAGALRKLREAWPAIAGADVAAKARLASLEGGVLRLQLASAALRHHLATFRSTELLARLREVAPEAHLRSLRFELSDQL